MDEKKQTVTWTEAGIEALVPTGKREQFTDPTNGMILLVTPNGAKTFYLVYRFGGGRTGTKRWFKLGRFGRGCSLAEARKRYKKFAAEASGGNDPQGERKSKRMDRNTVNDLCNRFERDYLDTGEVATSTAIGYRQHMRAHIRPELGRKLVKEVGTGEISPWRQLDFPLNDN